MPFLKQLQKVSRKMKAAKLDGDGADASAKLALLVFPEGTLVTGNVRHFDCTTVQDDLADMRTLIGRLDRSLQNTLRNAVVRSCLFSLFRLTADEWRIASTGLRASPTPSINRIILCVRQIACKPSQRRLIHSHLADYDLSRPTSQISHCQSNLTRFAATN